MCVWKIIKTVSLHGVKPFHDVLIVFLLKTDHLRWENDLDNLDGEQRPVMNMLGVNLNIYLIVRTVQLQCEWLCVMSLYRHTLFRWKTSGLHLRSQDHGNPPKPWRITHNIWILILSNISTLQIKTIYTIHSCTILFSSKLIRGVTMV